MSETEFIQLLKNIFKERVQKGIYNGYTRCSPVLRKPLRPGLRQMQRLRSLLRVCSKR